MKRLPARPIDAARTQRGMGLVELLVVMLISLFMMMGLFSIVYGTRTNYLAQNQLGQLQDGERLAMSMLTSVVQTGGYFPNPATTTAAAALPPATIAGVAFGSGQAISGTLGDQIYVRYVAGTNDGIMDCNGQTNTTGAALTNVNTFYVNGSQQLVCQVIANGVPGAIQPVVNGVTAMAVMYGVDTNADLSVDEYQTAAQVNTAGAWNKVVSVRVTLTFSNALSGAAAPGTGAAPQPTLTRVIDLLNKS